MSKLFAVLVLLAFTSAALTAGEVVGWRGDGTGSYPQAAPPVQWQQVSKAVDGLRFQAEPPKDNQPAGNPMPDGIIREWLILGPIADTMDEKKLPADPAYADDQSKLEPALGRELAGTAWKAMKTDTAFIDFARQFDSYGKDVQQAAYAATWIYSPADAKFIINVNHSDSARMWINGKLTQKASDRDMNYSPQSVALHQGWNTLLLRSTPVGAKSAPPLAGTWYVNVSFRAPSAPSATPATPASPARADVDQKNIQWKVLLPACEGFGAPIVVGGKILLLSEPADLVCLDAATGKILWVRSNNYDEFATEAEKTDHPDIFQNMEALQLKLRAVNDSFATASPPKLQEVGGGEGYKDKTECEKQLYSLMKQVDDKKYLMPKGQDVGYAGFTPVSDGKRVWAWFATGVTCCYDLDGKLIWRRLDNEGSFWEHGYSVSPLLADGKVMVFMNKLIAFDASTGERLWTNELSSPNTLRYHGTPVAIGVGGTNLAVLPSGHIVRLSDGKFIRDKGSEIGKRHQEIPSPVAIGNTIYELSIDGHFYKVLLPGQFSDPLDGVSVQSLKVDMSRYPTYYFDWFLASPLIHDGLAYCVNGSGVLSVIDLEKTQIVYEKLLDLDHFENANEGPARGIGISPSLAGGKIYILGDAGATIVLKPGRTYEQLAKNKIESIVRRNWQQRTERFVAAPFFSGSQMYIRGEKYLYCFSSQLSPP